MSRTLIIFVKEPVAGRVKTRLGRDIGMTSAAWWYRHQSTRLIRNLSADPRWATRLAISPDQAIGSTAWPVGPERVSQGRGDLGARMIRALTTAPPGQVVLVGSDIPGITPNHVTRAFKTLHGKDAVFGPARDGGYWLIGLANSHGTIPQSALTPVRWSTEHALDDSITSLAPLRIALADQLDDVDTVEDLRTLSRT